MKWCLCGFLFLCSPVLGQNVAMTIEPQFIGDTYASYSVSLVSTTGSNVVLTDVQAQAVFREVPTGYSPSLTYDPAEWGSYSAGCHSVVFNPGASGLDFLVLNFFSCGSFTVETTPKEIWTFYVAYDSSVEVSTSFGVTFLATGLGALNLFESYNWNWVNDGELFQRGDANNDGSVSLSDQGFISNYLFQGGPTPDCLDAADANDDGSINVADQIFILAYLFQGGPPPPQPGSPHANQECGVDWVTVDSLSCLTATCP